MTRRLLGYVVKLPDGTRHGRTREPRSGATAREIANEFPFGEAWVTPVFATRKPKPARISADEWNAAHPIGARVRYWPLRPTVSEDAPPIETNTRSEAWTLGSGDAVVKVDGIAGGVALTHVDVLDEPKPAPVAPVVAAEGRPHVESSWALRNEAYALLVEREGNGVFVPVSERGEIGSREEAWGTTKATPIAREETSLVVRVMKDGEHEAALAAARREGAADVYRETAEVLALLCDEYVAGKQRNEAQVIRRAMSRLTARAAKGQAK